MHTLTTLPDDKALAYAELEASLRALLAGEARQQLSTMGNVAGGGNDRVLIPYNGPLH